MNSTKIALKDYPEMRNIIQRAFRSYSKHKAYISTFPESGININSYWSEGSRREFALVNLQTFAVKQLPTDTHPWFDLAAKGYASQETKDVITDHVGNLVLKRLPANFALVEAGWSCGQKASAHIYFSGKALEAK